MESCAGNHKQRVPKSVQRVACEATPLESSSTHIMNFVIELIKIPVADDNQAEGG